MMKRLIKPIALWLLTLTVLAIIMLSIEADLLWKVQQHNVFLNTSLFFNQMMAMPGGMLSYLGTFFTQHFYYPWAGVILLCGWWLLLMWQTKRAFNLPDRWTVVSVIPVAILLVANMDMGYWVYFMKLPGYFYAATIGTTAAVALIWAFRCLPENKWIRSAYIFVVTLAGYPLLGVYALAAVAMMAVLAWRMYKEKTTSIILSVVALLSIIAIPLLYYRFVYVGTNAIDIYRVGIPVFGIVDTYPNFYIPYYILGLFFLLVSLTFSAERSERAIKTKDWVHVCCYCWLCILFLV